MLNQFTEKKLRGQFTNEVILSFGICLVILWHLIFLVFRHSAAPHIWRRWMLASLGTMTVIVCGGALSLCHLFASLHSTLPSYLGILELVKIVAALGWFAGVSWLLWSEMRNFRTVGKLRLLGSFE